MRLLVAEDEKRLNKIICEALEDEATASTPALTASRRWNTPAPPNTTR